MPRHRETRHLPYTPQQMYALVADVERYPEFLPWCLAARVKNRDDAKLRAELMIGFKVFRERFTSEIRLNPHESIEVIHGEGPFKHLRNHWKFAPHPDGGTLIDFHVDFEFKSRVLQAAIQALFSEAVRRMVAAFESRAESLYSQ